MYYSDLHQTRKQTQVNMFTCTESIFEVHYLEMQFNIGNFFFLGVVKQNTFYNFKVYLNASDESTLNLSVFILSNHLDILNAIFWGWEPKFVQENHLWLTST